ncbi:MAPEG family protein [uncultured Sphingomonas sp.]|uniref:MAPEG family protein n=1 Tax=uncultured Sphingomonas sp. TaxID=158754 RepID=UPI0035CB30FF
MMPDPGAGLSPFALLWPTFALVAVIMAVWATLFVRRMRHIGRNPPKAEDFATGEAASRYFQPVEMPANNLANLFEMPVLYFALVPLLLMFRQVTTAQLLLAWFFVILRATHSFIHVGPNVIKARFGVYLASVAVLVAMWIGFFVDALAGSRLYSIHAGLMAQL